MGERLNLRILLGEIYSLLFTSKLFLIGILLPALIFTLPSYTIKSSYSELIFFDDFNDGIADGWTEHLGSWNVINEEYFVTVGIVENGITSVNSLDLTDCIIETTMRFADTSVGFKAGILFRYTDNSHYYNYVLSNEYDNIVLDKYSPGHEDYGEAISDVGEGVRIIQEDVDYSLKLVIQGDTFTCYLNGEEVLSGSDDSYSSGKIGLWARRADVYFDDFKVYTRARTKINIMFTPNPAGPSQKVELYGILTEIGGTPIHPASVTIEYSLDDGTTWNYGLTLGTNLTGEFSRTFTAPAAGEYLVRVSYKGSGTYNPSSYTETLSVELQELASFDIWTDKTSYSIGETMEIYVRVNNPGVALAVKAIIKLKLPDGSIYGPLLDMRTTLPAGFDSGIVLWKSFTLPTVASGTYSWIAELRNPTTGALIDSDTWAWTVT